MSNFVNDQLAYNDILEKKSVKAEAALVDQQEESESTLEELMAIVYSSGLPSAGQICDMLGRLVGDVNRLAEVINEINQAYQKQNELLTKELIKVLGLDYPSEKTK